ncbi:phosphatidylserine decarboxylase [Arenibaculum pallidiluteum]|uniref:phosphatidylserine decarboxylase n=1 Tax=Arenibaculum pallidiluteum TaxID=2812559 RepID=UPI001A95E0FB|nr:phosphatidylserine decarboxylase [Arenibaculum pallidiluteum]
MSALSTVLVPINRAGWPFIALFAIATALLAWIAEPLGWIGAILTAWCVYFFRDPDRVVPTREGLVVAPADGTVQMIVPVTPPPELGMGSAPLVRISIFLNVFNVHINRTPVGGTVEAAHYSKGRFMNAALDKASEENERMAVRVRMADGRDVAFVQIAGLIARRILCDLRVGQEVVAGERYGLIRFGSRTDIYLPEGAQPLVIVGQKTLGGETVIADLLSTEPPRRGEVR